MRGIMRTTLVVHHWSRQRPWERTIGDSLLMTEREPLPLRTFALSIRPEREYVPFHNGEEAEG